MRLPYKYNFKQIIKTENYFTLLYNGNGLRCKTNECAITWQKIEKITKKCPLENQAYLTKYLFCKPGSRHRDRLRNPLNNRKNKKKLWR